MISAFVNITNPETAGYPYVESIRSFASLCDEVIVVDGGSTDGSLEKIEKIKKVRIIEGERWKRDFDWEIIGRNQQIGYESCKHNWRFLFATDFIFHEDYIGQIKKEIETAKESQPAIFIRRLNILTKERAVWRTETPWLVNSGHSRFLGYGRPEDNGSFSSPILVRGKDKGGNYGEAISKDNCPTLMSRARIHCYDYTFMTEEQIKEQRWRFARSLARYQKRKAYSKERAYELFIRQMSARRKQSFMFSGHSRHIIDKLNNLTPTMRGYDRVP